MVDHGRHILHPKVIGPGCGQINLFYHIFSVFIIKMSVLHNNPPFLMQDKLVHLTVSISDLLERRNCHSCAFLSDFVILT